MENQIIAAQAEIVEAVETTEAPVAKKRLAVHKGIIRTMTSHKALVNNVRDRLARHCKANGTEIDFSKVDVQVLVISEGGQILKPEEGQHVTVNLASLIGDRLLPNGETMPVVTTFIVGDEQDNTVSETVLAPDNVADVRAKFAQCDVEWSFEEELQEGVYYFNVYGFYSTPNKPERQKTAPETSGIKTMAPAGNVSYSAKGSGVDITIYRNANKNDLLSIAQQLLELAKSK